MSRPAQEETTSEITEDMTLSSLIGGFVQLAVPPGTKRLHALIRQGTLYTVIGRFFPYAQ